MNTDTLQDAFRNLPGNARQWQSAAEGRIREQPLAAVGIGALIGFLFPFRLFTGLVGMLLHLAMVLFKPALLVLAVMKLAEVVRAQGAAAPEATPAPTAAPVPVPGI